jgi:hypothetical protein
VRFTGQRILAPVSAAILIVLGVDCATFASTGDSLILGRFNAAHSTTTVVNRGAGPALSLKASKPRFPALRVNTHARIRRLNADLVDGMNGAQLATPVITFRAGAGGEVHQGVAAWELPLSTGVFQASFTVGLVPATGSAGAPVSAVCGLVDPRTVGPNTLVYAADSTLYAGGNIPAFVSGTTTLRVGTGTRVALVCTSESPEFTMYAPATASFAKVTSDTVRTAQPLTLAQRSLGRFSASHR